VPSFRTGTVTRLLEERAGLQRVEVDLGDGPERAYVLTQLTGRVDPLDDVVVNTTAVVFTTTGSPTATGPVSCGSA